MEPEKISAALIVRDGESTLERCLLSIKDHVDEIVIALDSRTKDKSKSIARKYGAKVYRYEWIDSFCHARNFAASKCSNDWILVVDADDFIAPDQTFETLIPSTEFAGASLLVQTAETSRHYSPRIYRQSIGKYCGRIHEYIDYCGASITNLPIRMIHARGEIIEPGRNLRILKDIMAEYPRYMFYFGREHIHNNQPLEGIQILTQYIPISTFQMEKMQAINDIIMAYYGLKDHTSAKKWCFSAISIEPRFVPAYYILGRIAADTQDWVQCVNWLESAINMEKNKIGYLFDDSEGIHYLICDWLSIAYYYIGDFEIGRIYLDECLEKYPGNQHYLDNKKWYDSIENKMPEESSECQAV